MDDNPDNIELLKWGHHIIKARMEATNRPLLPIPFRPVVYMVGTGDNDSGFSLKGWRSKKIMLKKLLGLRPLTARLRREFLLGPS
ncbi:hypothetical protein AW736_20215 [Termitidicoccus mucosus]|uniref:Uncharacterized protein n=2 Tax=Termitidicoccus mucosus TaxID=1184151 RepID=A0A178ICW9_9BACT|nr:hypothetical protein AW736_20215 [Opitutaceae bacterium TSB47]